MSHPAPFEPAVSIYMRSTYVDQWMTFIVSKLHELETDAAAWPSLIVATDLECSVHFDQDTVRYIFDPETDKITETINGNTRREVRSD